MSQRLPIEFAGATIAAALLVAGIAAIPTDYSEFEWVVWQSVAYSGAAAVAQWLVLRRYVAWAQWWALATLLGEFTIATAVTELMNLAVIPTDGEARSQIIFTLASGLGVALAQFPTLYGRVADAWLWIAAAAFARFIVFAMWNVVLASRTDIEIELMLLGSIAIQTAITATVQAVTLGWLLRKPLATMPTGPTRLEFVIAWAAVPIIAYEIARVAELAFFVRGGLSILFAALFAGGQAWVVSSIAVDQSRWRLVAAVCAIAIVVVYGLLGEWPETLTGTRAGALGALGLVAALATGAVLWREMQSAQRAPAAVEPSVGQRRL